MVRHQEGLPPLESDLDVVGEGMMVLFPGAKVG